MAITKYSNKSMDTWTSDQVLLVVPHSRLKVDASFSFSKVPSDQKLDEFKTQDFFLFLYLILFFLYC